MISEVAAVDSQHPRIAIKPADLIFAHEPVAAEELQALVDEAVHFGDPQLGRGRRIGHRAI
jgi:hypothetical protein